MPSVHDEFLQRIDRVPPQGVGLSVDVYSPNLCSLLASLSRRQVFPAYCEVFRAAPAALAMIRRHTECSLTYHGEGLWVTQPGADRDPLFLREAQDVAAQVALLRSPWSNHECATKQIAGYAFGTYLPPLYTTWSADLVAANIRAVQAVFDRECRLPDGATPLFLLEMAPLTYFVAGTLSIPAFFRRVTEQAACGLVLDIGHLWTVYRYSGAWRTYALPQFVEHFLKAFPVERVVEIHVAGLALHEAVPVRADESDSGQPLPCWIDAHMAPIPAILFELLDQVLAHPRLAHLKGLALEVDTKPIDLIGEEFETFSRRYAAVFPLQPSPACEVMPAVSREATQVDNLDLDTVTTAYERYALVVSGHVAPEGSEWTSPTACSEGLALYQAAYVPHEILVWGGEIQAMFPETCRGLAAQGVALEAFVPFWFSRPRPVTGPYDFFEIKIDRFLEFVEHQAPDVSAVALREAQVLREAYQAANESPLEDVVSETR